MFSYGTVETDKGLAVQSPDGEMGDHDGFAALSKNVPEPFKQEFNGGAGMHIHDKFVVVDFNGDNPTVFTGSSNLAAGGEQANGDSLAMIEDAAVANMFAIEAVALFDHFHFRKVMQQATARSRCDLWYPGKPNAPATPWWKAYYDPKNIQMRDRCCLPSAVAGGPRRDQERRLVGDRCRRGEEAGREEQSAATGAKTSPSKSSAKKKPAKKKPAKKKPAKKKPAKKKPVKKSKKPAAKASSAKKKKGARKKAPAKKPAKRRGKK